MRLPNWLRQVGKPRPNPETGTVTVTLTANTEAWSRAMVAAGRTLGAATVSMRFFGEAVRAAMDADRSNARLQAMMGATLRDHQVYQESPVWAGVLSRWYVRGGLSYVEYPEVADRDAVVQDLARTPSGRDMAVAFMRGWAEAEGTPASDDGPPVVPAHRLWGSTVVQVVTA